MKYNWSFLKEDINRFQSTRFLARIYGCSRSIIRRQLKRQNIKRTEADRIARKDIICNWIGRKAELDAIEILKNAIDVAGSGNCLPYDLLWNGKRINVKSCSKPMEQKGYLYWHFDIRGKEKCDYLLCIGYLNENIAIALFIPSNAPELPNVSICLPVNGRKNKYSKYVIISQGAMKKCG
jgi:hypothetical protein